jgi:sugar diacid utilization regulator
MEVARLQGLGESEPHRRRQLVLDLVGGADLPGILNRAQGLGYDLGRPHRVIAVEGRRQDDIDAFAGAVGRAAADTRVASLLAPRTRDVIVLADAEVPWERFRASVVAELHGARCRVGVGGRCLDPADFPRSCREATVALRIQKAVRSREQVTLFEQLGVYQVLGTAQDAAAMERFARQWLGALLDYDAVHGTQLVRTLGEYLDLGGGYDASARALSVHRSTLKYRLKRIREVSGHDLAVPDTQFNLQLATRAWRTLQALRGS